VGTHALLEVALDLGERARLLQAVAADVEREVVDVDEDLDPVEVALEVVLAQVRRDEDAAHKELERVERDIVLAVKVVGQAARDVDEGAESRRACVALEVRPREGWLTLLERLHVKALRSRHCSVSGVPDQRRTGGRAHLVLVLGHVLRLTHPQRRTVVDELPLGLGNLRLGRIGVLDLELVVLGKLVGNGLGSRVGEGARPKVDRCSVVLGVLLNQAAQLGDVEVVAAGVGLEVPAERPRQNQRTPMSQEVRERGRTE